MNSMGKVAKSYRSLSLKLFLHFSDVEFIPKYTSINKLAVTTSLITVTFWAIQVKIQDLTHSGALLENSRVQKKSRLHGCEPEEGFLNLCQF